MNKEEAPVTRMATAALIKEALSKANRYMADKERAFMDNEITENVIYEKLLNDKLSTNLGYVYENVIAQMLRATGKNLFYHTIPYAEGKKYYEIDFLITKSIITSRKNICPIEVKSSTSFTITSLEKCMSKFNQSIGHAYVLHTGDVQLTDKITYLCKIQR